MSIWNRDQLKSTLYMITLEAVFVLFMKMTVFLTSLSVDGMAVTSILTSFGVCDGMT